MTAKLTNHIPQALRTWFVIHFFVDILFAIPLMLAPTWILSLLGWQSVDPFTARLVSAALFGIGTESYLGRSAGIESFRNMLNLKIIWSLTAVIGIGLSIFQGAQGQPWFAWAILVIFIVFNFLWIYWRRQLK